MDLDERLRILADAARYDASCASSGSRRGRASGGIGTTEPMGICHSYTPDGRCISLLRILLTNACLFDCRYCVNRVSSDVPRARFTPVEVAELTLAFYRRNYIEGLFLSSGIFASPDDTMAPMIEAARLLREEHRFSGYIHLKAVPGASSELLAQAARYADRLSANLELPTQADLDALAPAKSVAETERTMGAIASIVTEGGPGRVLPAGQSTQFVVGATGATDASYLRAADRLYRDFGLRRIYYSAYAPVPNASAGLPAAPPPLAREHRMYQADWLLRRYGFDIDELFAPGDEQLRVDIDPKLAWALRHREWFPVDVNAAPREALLRVPGLGVKTVGRILAMRRTGPVRLHDLARLRVSLRKVRPFVITADARPIGLDRLELDLGPDRQLELFGGKS